MTPLALCIILNALVGCVGDHGTETSATSCLEINICGTGTSCDPESGLCLPDQIQATSLDASASESVSDATAFATDLSLFDGGINTPDLTMSDATMDLLDAMLVEQDGEVSDAESVDAAIPLDSAETDMVLLDSALLDVRLLDAAAPDMVLLDAILPDASLPDVTLLDADLPDLGTIARCDDQALNGDETAVDCGGVCAPCSDGDSCFRGTDCESGVCTNNVCRIPSCDDTVHNGLESDTDCGGECRPCNADSTCVQSSDCESLVCESGVCMTPTCTDGVHNGLELDLDCGAVCQPCDVWQMCQNGSDCVHGVCEAGLCQPHRCGDGVINGTEGCDDANLDPNDACTSDCLPARCGDGYVHAGWEACDTQIESRDCDVDCTFSECGDGRLNSTAGEHCDDGGESPSCNADCTFAECGDGTVNAAAGETCDGGARCDAQCQSIPIPTVRVHSMDGHAYEGSDEGGTLRVQLSEAVPVSTTVPFNLVGTAIEASDFVLSIDSVPLVSPLVIPPNVEFIDIAVDPIRSNEMERTEWVSFGLNESVDVEIDASARRARVWFYEFGLSMGSTYYVSPEGSDQADGSELSPFATLQFALQAMEPGDTLYLYDGVYNNPGYVETHGPQGDHNIENPVVGTLSFQGDRTKWTTIAAYPDGNDERPVLRFDGAGGLLIERDSSYLIIDGIEIHGPNEEIRYEWAHEHRWSKEALYMGRGIFTWGPAHHIVVRNCFIHHTPNSGIRFNGSDYILVENNVVANTTWWSSSAESGIVIATAAHIDELDTVKILYAGNVVYNNWNLMEFCSGPLGPVGGHQGSTADEYGNCDVYTGGIIDGQGLYVTRNRDTYRHGRMRFENNIAFNNGFGGVVYHKTDRGELFNNLVFMNGAYPGQSNYTGLTLNTVQDIRIINNIIWAREADDYALKNNGDVSEAEVRQNYVVGVSQLGSDAENAFVTFDSAAPFDEMFEHVLDIAQFRPDPHLLSGPSSAEEIGAQVEALQLRFVPLSTAGVLIDSGAIDDAPPTDILQRIRPRGMGVDIGPYEVLP